MSGDFTASYLTSCTNTLGLPGLPEYSLGIAKSAELEQLGEK